MFDPAQNPLPPKRDRKRRESGYGALENYEDEKKSGRGGKQSHIKKQRGQEARARGLGRTVW